MKKLLSNLQFIFKPSYWLMNERYSKLHDDELNRLMDKYKFTRINGYTAYLGNTEIWISNFPYGVGIRSVCQRSRPSRLTIQKMNSKLIKDALDDES